MSTTRISTVLLIFNVAEEVDDVVVTVNDWLNIHRQPPLRDMTPGVGGHRRPLCVTYGAVVNWLRETSLVELFDSYPWLFPENAVLVIQEENRPSRIFRADSP